MPQQTRPRIQLTRDQKSVVALLFIGLVFVIAIGAFVDASWRDMTSLRTKAESYPGAFYAPPGGETSLLVALAVVFVSSFLAAATVDRSRNVAWAIALLGIALGALTSLSPLGHGYILTAEKVIVFDHGPWHSGDVYELDKVQPAQVECQIIPRHPEDSYRLIYKILVPYGESNKEIDIARGVDAVTVRSWLHVLPSFDLTKRPASDEFGPPPLLNEGARSKKCEDYYDTNLNPNERETLHSLLDLERGAI